DNDRSRSGGRHVHELLRKLRDQHSAAIALSPRLEDARRGGTRPLSPLLPVFSLHFGFEASYRALLGKTEPCFTVVKPAGLRWRHESSTSGDARGSGGLHGRECREYVHH